MKYIVKRGCVYVTPDRLVAHQAGMEIMDPIDPTQKWKLDELVEAQPVLFRAHDELKNMMTKSSKKKKQHD